MKHLKKFTERLHEYIPKKITWDEFCLLENKSHESFTTSQIEEIKDLVKNSWTRIGKSKILLKVKVRSIIWSKTNLCNGVIDEFPNPEWVKRGGYKIIKNPIGETIIGKTTDSAIEIKGTGVIIDIKAHEDEWFTIQVDPQQWKKKRGVTVECFLADGFLEVINFLKGELESYKRIDSYTGERAQ